MHNIVELPALTLNVYLMLFSDTLSCVVSCGVVKVFYRVYMPESNICIHVRFIRGARVFIILILVLITTNTAVARNRKCRSKPMIGVLKSTGYAKPIPSLLAESMVSLTKYITMLEDACKDLNIDIVILPENSEKIQDYIELVDGILIGSSVFKFQEEYLLQEHLSAKINKIEGQQSNQVEDEKLIMVTEYNNIFEVEMIKAARRAQIPVFGIDTGMHMMVLSAGGSIGILGKINASSVNHGNKKYLGRHDVFPLRGSKLLSIAKQNTLSNLLSSHAKSVSTTGRGIVIAAKSEDGIIEAVESTSGSFFIGVQWHPEEEPQNGSSYNIFRKFCKAVVATNKTNVQMEIEKEKITEQKWSFDEEAKRGAQLRKANLESIPDYSIINPAARSGISSYIQNSSSKTNQR